MYFSLIESISSLSFNYLTGCDQLIKPRVPDTGSRAKEISNSQGIDRNVRPYTSKDHALLLFYIIMIIRRCTHTHTPMFTNVPLVVFYTLIVVALARYRSV